MHASRGVLRKRKCLTYFKSLLTGGDLGTAEKWLREMSTNSSSEYSDSSLQDCIDFSTIYYRYCKIGVF